MHRSAIFISIFVVGAVSALSFFILTESKHDNQLVTSARTSGDDAASVNLRQEIMNVIEGTSQHNINIPQDGKKFMKVRMVPQIGPQFTQNIKLNRN